METGRGRSSKKPWHLTLRLTEVVFAVFGMLGLLMMSFTLGVLAGRGDIYRVAYSLGLLVPEPQQAAQGIPPLGLTPAPTQSAAALAPAVAPGPAAAGAGHPGGCRRQAIPARTGHRLHGPAPSAGRHRLRQEESGPGGPCPRAKGPGRAIAPASGSGQEVDLSQQLR